MRIINYRRDDLRSARCGFAKISSEDREWLVDQLTHLLLEISERSNCGDDLWQAATEPDQRLWGRGQRWGSWRPNTMLSVIAGLIEKLGRGDLTDRQVDHCRQIIRVCAALRQHKILQSPLADCQFTQQLIYE